MPSTNLAVIMGNVGKSEMRFTTSGTAKLEFSVATNYGTKQADGTWKDNTTWHNCVIWGQQAERLAPRIDKGSMVLVQGRIDNRSWDDDQGKRHYRTEIVGDRVQVIKATGAGAGEPDGQAAFQQQEQRSAAVAPANTEPLPWE